MFTEGAVLGEQWNNRCRQLSQVLAIATTTGFSTVYTQIEQVLLSRDYCTVVHKLLHLMQVFGEDCIVCPVEQLLSGKPGGSKEGKSVPKVARDSGASENPNGRVSCLEKDSEACTHPKEAESVERDSGASVDTSEGGDRGRKSEGGDGEGKKTEQGATSTAELEEVLYQSLVGGKVHDESLEERAKALFDSCSSVTAKESLLLSLRCALFIQSVTVYVCMGAKNPYVCMSGERYLSRLHASWATPRLVIVRCAPQLMVSCVVGWLVGCRY